MCLVDWQHTVLETHTFLCEHVYIQTCGHTSDGRGRKLIYSTGRRPAREIKTCMGVCVCAHILMNADYTCVAQ